MLALIEILALIIVHALIQAAFVRWKRAPRVRRKRRPASAPIALHYPQHPGPVAGSLCAGPALESPAHIRPAGLDF